MIVELPDHLVSESGAPVFTALVYVKDGKLNVMVPIPAPENAGEAAEHWLGEEFDCEKGQTFAAQLEVYGDGGGSA